MVVSSFFFFFPFPFFNNHPRPRILERQPCVPLGPRPYHDKFVFKFWALELLVFSLQRLTRSRLGTKVGTHLTVACFL